MTTTLLLGLAVLAGTGQVKIIALAGTPMADCYCARAVTCLHDDLRAKRLILEMDSQRAAVVFSDVMEMRMEIAIGMLKGAHSWK